MYPRIPQPLTKTVIRTKSPITTSKPDISLKTPDTSQSKNKLHSSHSSHSPTPTKNNFSSSASKAKNPQDVLKSWYSSNNSTTVYGKSPARIHASPITGMSTEPDLREYKSLTNRTPNKTPMRMRQIGEQSDSRDDQENLNYLSFSSRKVEGYTSSSRNRENNNKSVHLSDFESENLKKHLNSDMRISLGNYVLQKLTGRILKKAAMKKLAENMEHKRGEFQEKLFKLIALAAEAEADKKDRKKAPELFDFQDEEILTETGTHNSKDTIGVNSVPIESVDRRYIDHTKTSLDKYKSQKMSKGQSQSALPTESNSTERSNRTAEDWAELFLKKVEMDTKKDKNLVKQEPKGNGKVQQQKSKDTSKAAIVLQRAFRRYVKRIKRNKVQTVVQNQPVKIEKVNIQERKGSSPVAEKRLSSSGMIEQLATELDLAKKKMSYLQKENETLEEKVKKMESEIDKRVNERLTIERARIKDTLSEYSSFIDKLLSEKKQLEEKAADQAKLITELCARLENKPAVKSLKELEDTLTEIESQKLKEKQEENNRLGEYQSIVKEKEALKTKLSARVLEPMVDFNTSRRIDDSNSKSFEHENRLNPANKLILEQGGNLLNRSASAKKVNSNDENRQGLHKGSFGGPEEKDYYHSVPNESAHVKPLPDLYFSPQVPGTESRKNSEQSQAESAKFMYNSYNQEPSSLLTGLADKKGQEFMFMSADTRTNRQNQDSKVRKNRGEMKSAERDIKSAREELEFSFEAKNNVKDDEDDFSEPFVLSVALQDRSPRKNLTVRSVSQEPKPSQEAQSLIVKPETRKNVISAAETKHARERLQMARMEKRKAKEQSEEEELVPELDNLIANLSKRLYIEEGNEGENTETKLNANPSISKSSSSEIHNEGGEALNKSENVFQRLSRSNQKG